MANICDGLRILLFKHRKKGYASFFANFLNLVFSFSIYLGSSMSKIESSVTPFPNAQQHKVISRCNEGKKMAKRFSEIF